jgi:acyl-CoA reductase-like NAD-dependent aldehyde dehydrogenase
MFAELATEAGLPPGVLNVINGLGDVAGQALVSHPGVDKVSFTGRLATGKQIMKLAADGIKGVTLELGGKTPNIIFPDTPLEAAASHAMMGIFIHLGQVCVAASRLLVHEDLHDDLLDLLMAKAKQLRQGDPTDQRNHLGCIATPAHLETIEQHVARAQNEGARLVIGGARPNDPDLAGGSYYLPTIFDAVTPDMTLAREEVFGPVLAVMTFKQEGEAVRIANDSNFGLMACLWTNDGQRALNVARQLRVGKVAINGGGAFRTGAPMSGYKQSGIGSDLGLDEAVREYTNSKTVLYSLAKEQCSWPV